jgi:3-hydroxyisobutyrate dehydrogenase-like beta-hydroxyacid dehydrogenase
MAIWVGGDEQIFNRHKPVLDAMGEVISQLERLSSNETKIAPRSVRIAVNGSDLSAPTFMVSSKNGR